jgi:hypothetical protein
MFYTLHRLVKWFFMLLAAGCLFWLYTQREALEPLYVWYDVYENGGIQKTERLPIVEGEGLHVLDGHTFQMKTGGRVISVRLTGFELPAAPLSPSDIQLEKARRELLRNFVIARPVRVQVTFSNANSLLGIVHVGETNLNTHYVARGLGYFNRDYVKSAPRDLQYKFFAAARARENDRALLAQRE